MASAALCGALLASLVAALAVLVECVHRLLKLLWHFSIALVVTLFALVDLHAFLVLGVAWSMMALATLDMGLMLVMREGNVALFASLKNDCLWAIVGKGYPSHYKTEEQSYQQS